MLKNQRKMLEKISRVFQQYLKNTEDDKKNFKGQIFIELNCVNGYIANSTTYINDTNLKKINEEKGKNKDYIIIRDKR